VKNFHFPNFQFNFCLFVCRNGYPDSTFLTLLSEALVTHGIEGAAAISQDQAKS